MSLKWIFLKYLVIKDEQLLVGTHRPVLPVQTGWASWRRWSYSACFPQKPLNGNRRNQDETALRPEPVTPASAWPPPCGHTRQNLLTVLFTWRVVNRRDVRVHRLKTNCSVMWATYFVRQQLLHSASCQPSSLQLFTGLGCSFSFHQSFCLSQEVRHQDLEHSERVL